MPRPRCHRRIQRDQGIESFSPQPALGSQLGEVQLSLDELEALRLADLQGLHQAQAAERMAISRATFGRLVSDARSKVARALVQGRVLRIGGGPVRLEPQQQGVKMRVAIAVDDKGAISAHFGRCLGFEVFEIEDGEVVARQRRDNPHKDQAGRGQGCHGQGRGGHGHGHGGHGGHGQGRGQGHRKGIGIGHRCDAGAGRGHRWIDDTLGDCQAVITRGIGAGAVSALRSLGVRPVVLDSKLAPEEAATLFGAGKL